MDIKRRQVIKLAAGSAATALISPHLLAQPFTQSKIKAIAFDGFPIYDPRPIFALTKRIFPNNGKALAQLWFTKIFGYTWLRTLGEQYKGFYSIIEDALSFSAESLKINLTETNKMQLLDVWLNLSVWPDVKPALEKFREKNIRLGFLSNFSEEMLRANARNSGIEDIFEFYLSTDRVEAYKPSPLAYQMGVDVFKLPKEQIAFAAFAGWDASGAKWFGYPTVWVNRLASPVEKLEALPNVVGAGMEQLVNFVLS